MRMLIFQLYMAVFLFTGKLSNYIWLFSCFQVTVEITRPVDRWRYADIGRLIMFVNVRRDILVTQPSAVAYPLRNEILKSFREGQDNR